MRTALITSLVVVACASGGAQPASDPVDSADGREESDGFNREEREALSELLEVDVADTPTDEEQATAPATSSSARPPGNQPRPSP